VKDIQTILSALIVAAVFILVIVVAAVPVAVIQAFKWVRRECEYKRMTRINLRKPRPEL
jgi:hypothetical protein